MAIIEDGLKDEGNDAQNPTDQEVDKDESIAGGEAGLERGGTHPEDGEDAGALEDEGGAEAEGSEPESRLDVKQIEESLLKKFDERLEKMRPPEPPPQPMTEEQWAKHEADWGVPRTTIQKTLDVAIKVQRDMRAYVDEKFSALERDSAISRLAKEQGFADVGRLRSGMDEFLKDFDPKYHADPVLLKKAAIFARGLASQKDIKTMRNSDEKNRQIANRIRPGRSEGGSSHASSRGLTPAQREAAELLEGGEAEYQKISKDRAKNRFIAA